VTRYRYGKTTWLIFVLIDDDVDVDVDDGLGRGAGRCPMFFVVRVSLSRWFLLLIAITSVEIIFN